MFPSTRSKFKGKCPQYYTLILQIKLTRGLITILNGNGLKWKRNVVSHVTRVASLASLVHVPGHVVHQVFSLSVVGGCELNYTFPLYFPLHISSLCPESRPLNVCPINKNNFSHLTAQSSTTLCQWRSHQDTEYG